MKVIGLGRSGGGIRDTYIVEISAKEMHKLMVYDNNFNGRPIEVGSVIKVPNVYNIEKVKYLLKTTLESLDGAKDETPEGDILDV